MARRRTDGPTYRAAYEDVGELVYQGRPEGNLVGELPMGAWPLPAGACGTIERTDGGDPFERARFQCPSGRVVLVERESPEQSRTADLRAPFKRGWRTDYAALTVAQLRRLARERGLGLTYLAVRTRAELTRVLGQADRGEPLDFHAKDTG